MVCMDSGSGQQRARGRLGLERRLWTEWWTTANGRARRPLLGRVGERDSRWRATVNRAGARPACEGLGKMRG
jgi:hypothetical protein